MDRAILLRHLAQTERHISEGAEYLARQQDLIDEMIRHKHDTRGAETVLATMRETQSLHIEHWARILDELANLSNED